MSPFFNSTDDPGMTARFLPRLRTPRSGSEWHAIHTVARLLGQRRTIFHRRAAGTRFASLWFVKRRKAGRKRVPIDPPPVADESTVRGDRELVAGSSLTGGDLDADVGRAASVGDEAPGGTVATPDQDRVDELGRALGVSREPDEEFRTSAEILEERKRYRREEEE
jgi:hypothetical protein